MMNRIDQLNQLSSVKQLQLEHASTGNGFGDLLRNELKKNSGVQFSKHAAQRVEQRGIEMTDTLLQNINQAVEKAKEKGARDVAIISSRAAFIVNIPNNTVITTISEAEMKENIFTNIDSAVLL